MGAIGRQADSLFLVSCDGAAAPSPRSTSVLTFEAEHGQGPCVSCEAVVFTVHSVPFPLYPASSVLGLLPCDNGCHGPGFLLLLWSATLPLLGGDEGYKLVQDLKVWSPCQKWNVTARSSPFLPFPRCKSVCQWMKAALGLSAPCTSPSPVNPGDTTGRPFN